jgi:hypothetical protein
MPGTKAGLMAQRASIALAAFLCCSVPALASQPPIVGLWSENVRESNGEGIAVVWDEFDSNGRVTVRFVTRAGTETYTGTYRLTNGGADVVATITDYEPKELCTLVCSPVRPVMPIGKSGVTAVRFVGTSTMYLGTDRFERQR